MRLADPLNSFGRLNPTTDIEEFLRSIAKPEPVLFDSRFVAFDRPSSACSNLSLSLPTYQRSQRVATPQYAGAPLHSSA